MVRACRLGLVCCLVSFGALVAASSARADQRRDWPLEGLQTGGHFYLDYFGTGAQGTLEYRGPIYGSSNSFSVNVSSLLSYPTGQVSAQASLRVLFLEFSGMVGYRAVWRNLSFEPGDNGEYCMQCDRSARRDRDPLLAEGPDTDRYPFAEATASVYLLLNEWMVFTSSFTAHYEDARARSFDQFYTNLHDGGMMYIAETTMFFKHRDYGGIGPYFQLMSLPRDGKHESEVALGFNAVLRLGLIKRNDALFFTFLTRPDDKYYGQHGYYLPARMLLVYRMALDL